MITEQALQEAIAECQGKREPNRQDCIMLAAFYTIQDHMFPPSPRSSYSFATPAELPSAVAQETTNVIGDYGQSDFLQAVRGKDPATMWAIMDGLMDTLKIVNARVYDGVMRKIR